MSVDKAEFIRQATQRMQKCIDNSDIEAAHADADDILVAALSADPDFKELLELWERVPKWCA